MEDTRKSREALENLSIEMPQTLATCPLARQGDYSGGLATCRHPEHVRYLEPKVPHNMKLSEAEMAGTRTAGRPCLYHKGSAVQGATILRSFNAQLVNLYIYYFINLFII